MPTPHIEHRKSETYLIQEGTVGHTVLFLTDQPYDFQGIYHDVLALLDTFTGGPVVGITLSNVSYSGYVLESAQYAIVVNMLDQNRYGKLDWPQIVTVTEKAQGWKDTYDPYAAMKPSM